MANSSNNEKLINESIKLFYADHTKKMIDIMKSAGNLAMNQCLDHPYMNRTFNLEDSLGYGVYVNGNNIAMVWANSARKAIVPNGVNRSYNSAYYGDTHMGRDVSKLFLMDYKSTNRFEMVVVAGEWYASFVENVHNLDVITGSFSDVINSIPKIFNKLTTK